MSAFFAYRHICGQFYLALEVHANCLSKMFNTQLVAKIYASDDFIPPINANFQSGFQAQNMIIYPSCLQIVVIKLYPHLKILYSLIANCRFNFILQ